MKKSRNQVFGILFLVDKQRQRIEDSFKKYPVAISEKLFREGFGLGKMLGLIQEEEFESVFSEKEQKKLEKLTSYYFSTWPEQIEYYLNPTNAKKDHMIIYFLKAKRKILNMKAMVIGEYIINLAKNKNLAKEVSFSSVQELIESLDKILSKTDISLVKNEPSKTPGVNLTTLKINQEETKTEFHFKEPHIVLSEVNKVLKQKGFSKRFVQFEEVFSGLTYGVMLINKNSLHLEDNPFIPFFSRNNWWVINKVEITDEIRRWFEKVSKESLSFQKLYEEMNKV